MSDYNALIKRLRAAVEVHKRTGCELTITAETCVELADALEQSMTNSDCCVDTVNHPDHYTRGGIECIAAIRASMTPDGFMDYCKGNVLKYLWRWRNKGGVEDLKKARVYLNWLIEEAEK